MAHRLGRDLPDSGQRELGVDVEPGDLVVHPLAQRELEGGPYDVLHLGAQVGAFGLAHRGVLDVEAAGASTVEDFVDRLAQRGTEQGLQVAALPEPRKNLA